MERPHVTRGSDAKHMKSIRESARLQAKGEEVGHERGGCSGGLTMRAGGVSFAVNWVLTSDLQTEQLENAAV